MRSKYWGRGKGAARVLSFYEIFLLKNVKERNNRSVTTPMNKFTGIYGLSPMVCDPIPISLRCFSLSLESFQLLATNLTSDTMRFEVK
jgi:hypothetical protein